MGHHNETTDSRRPKSGGFYLRNMATAAATKRHSHSHQPNATSHSTAQHDAKQMTTAVHPTRMVDFDMFKYYPGVYVPPAGLGRLVESGTLMAYLHKTMPRAACREMAETVLSPIAISAVEAEQNHQRHHNILCAAGFNDTEFNDRVQDFLKRNVAALERLVFILESRGQAKPS